MNYTSLLLVDDDSDDLLLFNEALSEIKAQVSCDSATDGVEALKKLTSATSSPHLIFLDLNMPIMHGFECLKRIKANKALQKIPVVIFTTSSSPLDINTARHLGASAYFCKPMRFNDLCEQLKSILSGTFELGSGFKIIEPITK
ncbi:MAG TPA: response regulator [Bacteroidia bacterium]|jgi:CheY-like chemotaxis protein|nr:response regulator [Bacteroidia bacterium]